MGLCDLGFGKPKPRSKRLLNQMDCLPSFQTSGLQLVLAAGLNNERTVKMDPSTATMRRITRARLGLQARLVHLFASDMPAWAFFLDFALYPPLVLLGLGVALIKADPSQTVAACAAFLVGLAVWTLAEYLIHRFVFHRAPVLKPIHMAHHDAPRALNGTPTLLTVAVFYGLVFWPLSALAGLRLGAAATAGVMAGYLAYVSVHYVVHHLGSGGRPILRRLIRLHAVHHHDSDHNFGVTSALWDRVFGTLARR